MKAAIFSFVPLRENSMIASVRIGRYLQERLQLPVICGPEIGEQVQADLLIIINGAFAFCKVLPQLAAAIVGARRVVWVQNDYTIVPPAEESGAESPFRRAWRERKAAGKPYTDFWTTVERNAARPGSSYVNWNALTWHPRPLRAATQPDLFYYGSFRQNRIAYFDRYFARPGGPATISSPTAKFQSRYQEALVSHIGPISLDTDMGDYAMGLYIEDKKSHSEYHSPANRFYEMLGAGLPMAFQPECGSMLRKAGIDPAPYVAANWREIGRLMERRDAVAQEQRELWGGTDYLGQLRGQVDAAWAKVLP